MDSNLRKLEDQVADLNRRFQTLENLIHMLQRSQQPPINAWPPRTIGGCPFCGVVHCVAGACRNNGLPNHGYTTGLKNETQLK